MNIFRNLNWGAILRQSSAIFAGIVIGGFLLAGLASLGPLFTGGTRSSRIFAFWVDGIATGVAEVWPFLGLFLVVMAVVTIAHAIRAQRQAGQAQQGGGQQPPQAGGQHLQRQQWHWLGQQGNPPGNPPAAPQNPNHTLAQGGWVWIP